MYPVIIIGIFVTYLLIRRILDNRAEIALEMEKTKQLEIKKDMKVWGDLEKKSKKELD